MKNRKPKDRQTQIITVVVSFLLIWAISLSGVKEELPMLCASVAFYAQTAAQSAESKVRENFSETETDETSAQTTSEIKISNDITRTPNDIVEIINRSSVRLLGVVPYGEKLQASQEVAELAFMGDMKKKYDYLEDYNYNFNPYESDEGKAILRSLMYVKEQSEEEADD